MIDEYTIIATTRDMADLDGPLPIGSVGSIVASHAIYYLVEFSHPARVVPMPHDAVRLATEDDIKAACDYDRQMEIMEEVMERDAELLKRLKDA